MTITAQALAPAGLPAITAQALDLVGDGHGRHVPGTPYVYEHWWVPLDGTELGKDGLRRPAKASPGLAEQAAAHSPAPARTAAERLFGTALQSDGSATAQAHLRDLEKVPGPLLRKVRGHGVMLVLTEKSAGHAEPGLGSAPARGHGGATWETVPGAYLHGPRKAILGNSGGHGTSSLALHEFAHAADDALGGASKSDEFKGVYGAVRDAYGPRLKPYYRQDDEDASRQEAFGELLGTWMLHRDSPPAQRKAAMLAAMGTQGGGIAEAMARVDAVSKADGYFARLAGEGA